MKTSAKLKTNVRIDNIQEFNDHVIRAQCLLDELNKELGVISSFELKIENKENGCI